MTDTEDTMAESKDFPGVALITGAASGMWFITI